MAESSITHNFILTDPDEVEMFFKALEESANEPPRPISKKFRYLQDPDELKEFMQKVKRVNSQRSLPTSSDSSERGKD